MKAWVTMGYFDDRGDGTVWELDAGDGSVREVLHFDPPPALAVPSKGFTGASWVVTDRGRDLLVCGAAAVFRFDGRSMAESGVLALPSFNDLHGVTATRDRIYVVNTGMDCIDVFDHDGRFVGTHGFDAAWMAAHRLRGETPARAEWLGLHARGWSGGPTEFRAVDDEDRYYRVDMQEPYHRRQQRDYVHPNHVQIVDGRVLVTSLVRCGVVDVGSWHQVVSVQSPPHDGIAADDGYYVTRVDGYVEVCDIGRPGDRPRVIDVSTLAGMTGWCRGLMVTPDALWVGFTEIRAKPGHVWDRGPFDATETAVVVLDRATGEVIRKFSLASGQRHGKVFAILEAA